MYSRLPEPHTKTHTLVLEGLKKKCQVIYIFVQLNNKYHNNFFLNSRYAVDIYKQFYDSYEF